jgi:hypothetical protein
MGISEVHGFCEECSLVKWDVELERCPARQGSFGKQQVSATCSAADRKIARTGVYPGKRH